MEDLLKANAPYRRMYRPLIMIAALCSLFAPSIWAQSVDPPDGSWNDAWAQPLDKTFNFHQMTPTLYRSALPTPASVPLLQDQGIQTVVSFIKDDDALWAGRSSLTLVSLPLHADRVSDADVLRVLRALQAAQDRGPVLMHCKHGRNRTGLMAALYRMVIQGWSREAALEEMHQGGFGDRQHLEQATRYVSRVDINRLRQAYANGECSTHPLSLCRLRTWWTAG